WAALMVLAAGLGPNAGTLALALHTAGVLGRLFAEALENTPTAPAEAIRLQGGGQITAFFYGTLPNLWPQLLAYTLYRWENNIRMASVLGFVGAGGLGQMLYISLSLFQEAQASTVIIACCCWCWPWMPSVAGAASSGCAAPEAGTGERSGHSLTGGLRKRADPCTIGRFLARTGRYGPLPMTAPAEQGQLKRGLPNRHIQLIPLGGAIGTRRFLGPARVRSSAGPSMLLGSAIGLFLGSAGGLSSAGPAMLLAHAIGGFIAFLIMRQLGEMTVEEPVAGSFSHFAQRYWGPFAGFLSGWTYWVLYILVGMAELTAVGKYVQYWYPEIPTWATALAFFVLINLINLTHVKAFGEAEFWFAIVKVGAIVGMILLGLYLLVSGAGGEQASVSNLWTHGGFFPNGIGGLVAVMAVLMFS